MASWTGDKNWVVGVQWHPERMLNDALAERLFEDFVAAAKNVRNALAPDVPDETLSRVLLVWTQLFGAISYELFGHFHNVIQDYDAFFEHQMKRSANLLVTGQL